MQTILSDSGYIFKYLNIWGYVAGLLHFYNHPDPYTPLRVAIDYPYKGQMPTLFVTGRRFF